MRVWRGLTWSVLSLVCIACAAVALEPATDPAVPTRSEGVGQRADLPVLGPAPDITNETWLNTDGPLSLAGLHGKVVLVEFWTFG